MPISIVLYLVYPQEHDEPVLAHLTDIKVVYTDDKGLVSIILVEQFLSDGCNPPTCVVYSVLIEV